MFCENRGSEVFCSSFLKRHFCVFPNKMLVRSLFWFTLLVTAQSTSLRSNSRLSTLVADSSFRGVVDELASGTPAHEIHLKIIKLQKTLNERHDSVTRTCEEDKKAVTKGRFIVP